jgi:hypothetical protein
MNDVPPSAILVGDHAQDFLVRHLASTELLLRQALRTLDPRSDCQVAPAADLGIPYDVIRLAGGFATGCVVEWSCSTPVVPIDTTMNIDTSSVFWIDAVADDVLDAARIEQVRRRIEADSSYGWNLNRGNHFISLCRRRSDQQLGIVIHSNEKEFKDQYNGLSPTETNWYAEDVFVYGPYGAIRLIKGRKAELFSRIAKMLEQFNIIRHQFFIMMLLDGRASVIGESHNHHYFMPTEVSAAIGCFLCKPGDIVPVFSTLGRPISLFEVAAGGKNNIHLASIGERSIVPHGWGMGTAHPVSFERSEEDMRFNGVSLRRRSGTSLLDHVDVVPRTFDAGSNEFFERIRHHTPGKVVDVLDQLCSYSKHGFLTHTAYSTHSDATPL